MGRSLRIIVADADGKNAGLLAFGFEREGMAPVVAHAAADVGALVAGGDIDAIVLSLGSTGLLTNAVTALRGMAGAKELPILALGDASARTAVLAAGASEFLSRPAYVRDVVSLVRLLALTHQAKPQHLSGQLADFSSIIYLLRALCETRRSGTVSLECAGRRAELVICDGTVSSATMGRAQGIDALRRLTLWQQGKLEVRYAAVPRSGQIGLELAALVESLGHFLRAAFELSPEAAGNALFEKDVRKVTEQGGKLAALTAQVLRDHDGRKRLWEVIADSALDGVETIAHTRRLLELGVLLSSRGARSSKAETPVALAQSDWVIGTAETPSVPTLAGYADVNEPSGNLPRIRPTPVPPEALMGPDTEQSPPPVAASGEIQVPTAPMLNTPWGQPVVQPQAAAAPVAASGVHPAINLPPPVLPEEKEHTDPDAPAMPEAAQARAQSSDGTVSGQLVAQGPRRATDEVPVASIVVQREEPAVIVRHEEPAVIVDQSLRAKRQSQPPPSAGAAIANAAAVAAVQPSLLATPPAVRQSRPMAAQRAPSAPGTPAQRPSNPDLMAQVQKTAEDAARAATRALAFDAQAEKFFREGAALANQKAAPVENFDDLDEKTEEQPAPGFWKKPKK